MPEAPTGAPEYSPVVTPRFVPPPRVNKPAIPITTAPPDGPRTDPGANLPWRPSAPPSGNPKGMSSAGLIPVSAQMPMPAQPPVRDEEKDESLIRSELPGPQTIFKRDSERDFFERMRRQMKRSSSDFLLPQETPLSKEVIRQTSYPRIDPMGGQPFARHEERVEPNYVCHRRLLFEQPNFERYGYDFGILQPGICLGLFWYDVAMLPYHMWSDLGDRVECSAGKCLPGDPTPLVVIPEHFSVTGLVAEAGTVFGILYAIPPAFVQ